MAMYTDDNLMQMLVLKGGNALDLIYGVACRASADLDFSVASIFPAEEMDSITSRIRTILEAIFKTEGYHVFDVTLEERPEHITADMASFWGGYRIEFKLIELDKFKKLADDHEALRRQATVLGMTQERKFGIDISKFEYCDPKREQDLEGYTIYVYTPEMIVCEKIRAICQQMPEYAKLVKSQSQCARARDYFDIHTVVEYFHIDISSKDNIELLEKIFAAKRVPLKLIGKIKDFKEYHRPDFAAVKDTVKPGTKLKDFDFYFDYVVDRCKVLKPLWEE
jgi:predicted nucleotidyltransferase component of viral defense system